MAGCGVEGVSSAGDFIGLPGVFIDLIFISLYDINVMRKRKSYTLRIPFFLTFTSRSDIVICRTRLYLPLSMVLSCVAFKRKK